MLELVEYSFISLLKQKKKKLGQRLKVKSVKIIKNARTPTTLGGGHLSVVTRAAISGPPLPSVLTGSLRFRCIWNLKRAVKAAATTVLHAVGLRKQQRRDRDCHPG